jgi:elongation factor G
MATHLSKLSFIRNIGIVAHVDAGKTTLTERMLFYTGALHKIGEVHEGAAHMDWMAEEQTHGITITAAVTRAPWRDHVLQIIDTPGHVDFTIEVERSMRILDGVIVVLDAVQGIEPQTETVWRQRHRFALPALFFVNKVDRPGADLQRVLEQIRHQFHVVPVPLTIPIPESDALLDSFNKTLIRFSGEQGEHVSIEPCPAHYQSLLASYREILLFAIAETDEQLAEQILNGQEPDQSDLMAALRRATLNGTLFPCYAGSALRNIGVQPLLDGILHWLPTPLDRPAARAHSATGSDQEITIGLDGPLVALIFKVQLWDGRRHCFTRIYRNRLRAGDTVELMTKDGRILREQVARIFDIDAGRKTRLEEAQPGQIVLLAGLRHATTGDTLCAPGHVISLERIQTYEPVLGLAIEPSSSQDEEKLLTVLAKITQEDPTLILADDPDTGQRLLKGMGELHLQIVLERLQREFQLSVRSGRPSVAVRETITGQATADAIASQPSTQNDLKTLVPCYRVRVAVAPQPRQAGIKVITDTALLQPEQTPISPEQHALLQQECLTALQAGPLTGAPLDDLVVTVLEIERLLPNPTQAALHSATSKALHKALQAAKPCLLYPIMRVQVHVPDDYLGVVLGDLQARHGLIRATQRQYDAMMITAEVALSQLLGYATELRSLTQGRGQFSMQFDRFDILTALTGS